MVEGKLTFELWKKRLTGVIVADTFLNKFTPISREMPRALFPICNVPNLHYVIEFLIMNGINHIIVAAKQGHREALKDQVRLYPKGKHHHVSIEVRGLEDSVCTGDVLREVDQSGIIKDDFVLVNSDFVSNIDLEEALRSHYKGIHDIDKSQLTEEEQCKALILTKVFAKTNFVDPCKSSS
jgi:translation initiation factor eIF-2B subunit epsilon